MIETIIQNTCGFLWGKRCVLAVSGGIDSMVLLSAMHRLAQKMELTLSVAHFEHGIRGADSLLDARLVEQTAHTLGLPFFLKQENIPALSHGENLEQVARKRRYAFLHSLDADYLLTAHHAGDNAETVLMKLMRGCGLDGLCGMAQKQGKIVRPLLPVSRQEIEHYARHNRIAYREDATNGDVSYTRNALRHQVIPFFVEKNPQFFTQIHRMAGILQQQRAFLDECVESAQCLEWMDYGGALKKAPLLSLHPAVQQRAVKLLLNRLMGEDMTHTQVDDVFALLTLPTGRKKRMKDGLWAYSSYDQVCFVWDQPEITEEYLLTLGEKLTPFGRFVVEEIKEHPDDFTHHSTTVAYIDQACYPLTVRKRKPGDRFIPFGHQTPKKVKQLLIDHHIPVFLRDRFPLVVFQDQVIFLPGIGQSNASRVTGNRLYRVSFFPDGKKASQH